MLDDTWIFQVKDDRNIHDANMRDGVILQKDLLLPRRTLDANNGYKMLSRELNTLKSNIASIRLCKKK